MRKLFHPSRYRTCMMVHRCRSLSALHLPGKWWRQSNRI